MLDMPTLVCAIAKRAALGVVATLAIGVLMAAAPAHAATADQCNVLVDDDFSAVMDAPTRVLASTPVAAKGTVPAYCRVEGYVASSVGIEFHLPMGNWNGKFVMQGCGGMCGSLQGIASCPEAVTRGYACGTTDMGHRGEGADGKWAYNNLGAEVDHGYRATHVATVAGKAITEAFYSAPIRRAYFRGCSTGGRQGLVEAQRFPYDFDGIIAGDAQLYSLLGPPLTAFWNGIANVGPDGKSVLTAAKLDLVRTAVLAACDALDGVEDGVIGDPLQCKFESSTIACKTVAADNCLTGAEMAAVRKFYQGPASKKGCPGRQAVTSTLPRKTCATSASSRIPAQATIFRSSTGTEIPSASTPMLCSAAETRTLSSTRPTAASSSFSTAGRTQATRPTARSIITTA